MNEAGRVNRAKCNARERGLPATLRTREWRAALAAFASLCAYCGLRPYERLDHFVPQARGGGTTAGNCLPACDQCNRAKGVMEPGAFAGLFDADRLRAARLHLAKHRSGADVVAGRTPRAPLRHGKGDHRPIAVRFWDSVDRSSAGDGCWLWLGRTEHGYGVISARGRDQRAHRVAWELMHGKIATGLILLHACDNPRCVRPDHLRPGTPRENTADMMAKGRSAIGDAHHQAKLSAANVAEIIRRRAAGEKYAALASRFHVSIATVFQAATGGNWKSVEGTRCAVRRHRTRLNRQDVAAIREQAANGESVVAIAAVAKLTPRYVRKIVAGEKHAVPAG